MKRYWLFMYDHYYPNGGMNDFKGDFDTIDECKKEKKSRNYNRYNGGYDNCEVYDAVEKQNIQL